MLHVLDGNQYLGRYLLREISVCSDYGALGNAVPDEPGIV